MFTLILFIYLFDLIFQASIVTYNQGWQEGKELNTTNLKKSQEY